MTLYQLNLSVSSFSGTEAGGSVSMGNAPAGDWSSATVAAAALLG